MTDPLRLPVPALLAIAIAIGAACHGGGGSTIATDGGGSDADTTAPDAAVDADGGTDGGTGAHLSTDGVTLRDDDPAVLGCRDICATETMIDCPRARDCVSACLMRLIEERCPQTERALIACSRHVTVDDFQCEADGGYPEIKPDICPAEQHALFVCIKSGSDVPVDGGVPSRD